MKPTIVDRTFKIRVIRPGKCHAWGIEIAWRITRGVGAANWTSGDLNLAVMCPLVRGPAVSSASVAFLLTASSKILLSRKVSSNSDRATRPEPHDFWADSIAHRSSEHYLCMAKLTGWQTVETNHRTSQHSTLLRLPTCWLCRAQLELSMYAKIPTGAYTSYKLVDAVF